MARASMTFSLSVMNTVPPATTLNFGLFALDLDHLVLDEIRQIARGDRGLELAPLVLDLGDLDLGDLEVDQ